MAPTGLLLINLGTPDEPSTGAVRRYLRQFLSDPRVLDMSAVGRFFLLNFVILPTRPAKSAHAYRTIWDPQRGSPLLYHTRDLVDAVGQRLGADWRVELGMRYGKPSIERALAALRAAGCDRIVAMPLFPQYASSSTGSALEEMYRVGSAAWNTPWFEVVPPFWDDVGYLDAFAEVGRPVLDRMQPDQILFSFHGLPERQILKSDDTRRHCLASASCCDHMTDANRNCYRAQCFATARGIAARLGLPTERWQVSFQSRLGRIPWIKPYTDLVIDELARSGVRKVAVFCPAFVADCLETVEEIGIRTRDAFRAAGGEELELVPSLNAHPSWADAVVAMVRREQPETGAAAGRRLRVVE